MGTKVFDHVGYILGEVSVALRVMASGVHSKQDAGHAHCLIFEVLCMTAQWYMALMHVQVHGGVLQGPSLREVAIKVQHKGVKRMMRADLVNMKLAMDLLDFILWQLLLVHQPGDYKVNNPSHWPCNCFGPGSRHAMRAGVMDEIVLLGVSVLVLMSNAAALEHEP
eukprot:1141305-Pelagomonas_calceolata.AAC.8